MTESIASASSNRIAPVVHHRTQEPRTRADHDAGADDRPDDPGAASRMIAASTDQRGRLDPRVGVDVGLALHPHARRDLAGARAGGPPSAARSTSVCACRYFSGVPMSIQYASLAIA